MSQSAKQIIDRYNAKRAIFNAMVAGRRISLLNSEEFMVSQMHTQICSIRRDIQKKNLPYVMRDRWVEMGSSNKNIKEYWLERV